MFHFIVQMFDLLMQYLVVGANGQFSVTIIANPSGPYMAGRDTVMLYCSASLANENTAYSWSCPSACFANGIMTQYIARVIQSEDDGANISCTATTGDVSVTSNNTVLISGQLYTHVWTDVQTHELWEGTQRPHPTCWHTL